jgi:hypothetical protein
MLHKITVAITTNASGVASVVAGGKIRGFLYALYYRPGTIETGADFTITVTGTGAPILTKSNLGTGNSWLYPRAKPTIANDATGGLNAAPTVPIPLINDTITIAVAQGGNTLTGAMDILIDDGRTA